MRDSDSTWILPIYNAFSQFCQGIDQARFLPIRGVRFRKHRET
jgi:hypothetical protein